MNNQEELQQVVVSIFESRYLKRIQRSGTSLLLGDEVKENVVEHSFYVSLWAIVLQHLKPELDLGKLLTICLIHDLEEVRTGDLNQINRLYQEKDNGHEAFKDMWEGTELGSKLIELDKERNEMKSPEAIAADDCDTLAELVTEKEYLEKGNQEAQEWIEYTIQRLHTPEAKQLADLILSTRLTVWWELIKNRIRGKHNLPLVNYDN